MGWGGVHWLVTCTFALICRVERVYLVQSVLKEIMETLVEKVIQVAKVTKEILVNLEVVVSLEKWSVHQE